MLRAAQPSEGAAPLKLPFLQVEVDMKTLVCGVPHDRVAHNL
jgi:hypothetical protein